MPIRLIKSSLRRSQILRFLIVGVFNTAFSYGVYASLIFLGVGYAVANLAALLLGILFSFKTQGSWVFQTPDNRRIWRFILGWGVIYLVSITLIAQFIGIGFNAYVAGILALPFSTVLSYLLQRFFVFHTPSSPLAERTTEKLQ